MKNLLPIKTFWLILLTVLSCTKLYGQIIYTDVNPDLTFNSNGTAYHLDLNNDGINDFNISYSIVYPGACSDIAQLNYYICITPVHNNSVGSSLSNPFFPLSLDSNSIIDKNMYWSKNPNQLLFSMTWYCQAEYWVGVASGNWINTSNKFLPLKLRVNGNSYYGWLGIDIDGYNTSFGSFRIKDYAFNTIINQPIRAGEVNCSSPAVTVAASGPLVFCNGDSVTLTANSNAYKYQWKNNGINISGATNSTYTATTAGAYKVKVTNSCGNKTSGSKVVSTPCRPILQDAETQTGNPGSGRLKVFPNPAFKTITIYVPGDEPSTVQIYNCFGIAVLKIENISKATTVDIGQLKSGIYYMLCSSGRKYDAKSFCVSR